MKALRAASVFDGERFITGGGTVLIEDGTVVTVEAGYGNLPEHVAMIDYGDATLLPGLIDTHVHLVGDGEVGALDRVAGYSPEQLRRVVDESLRRQLAGGVTTVRDLGDRDWVAVERRDQQRTGEATGARAEPTVLASGPPLTSPAGHCFFMGGEVAGRSAIEKAVRERAERGVDVVKVMASGGMNTPGTDVMRTQFSDDELEFLVERAHGLGLPVTAHAHGLPAVEQALRVRVDALEHCSCLTETGIRITDEVLETLTQRALPVGGALGAPSPHAVARMPDSVKAAMARAGITPAMIRDTRLAAVRRMHQAGVQFIAGRDSGIAPHMDHGTLPDSVAFLFEAGASVAHALAAATSRAAQACGVGQNKGSLRPGYDADILVVDGDLSVDVDRLRHIRAVLLNGQPIA